MLSIIDFALAAPVLVQEKRQACVDVVHIPRHAITVLGKRGSEELEKLAEEYFKASGKPVESSDTHASSSSAPPSPHHESTNVVQAPASNPASSTANPNLSVEPSSPPPPIVSESSALSDSEDYEWLFEPKGDDNIDIATSSGHGLDHELSSVPTGPDHGSTNVVQAPTPNPASLTANPNPLIEPSSSEPSPASSSSLSDSEYQWLLELPKGDHSHRIIHFPQPNPNKRPWTDMEPDPDFDWAHWTAYVNRPSASPPKEIGQTSEDQAGHVQQPAPGSSTTSDVDWNNYPVLDSSASFVHPSSTSAGLPTEPEQEVATPPSPNTGSNKEPEYDVTHGPPSNPELTDPELQLDDQSLSTDSQPMDPQDALYAAKGKAKQLRRISSTSRDIGNAAQRKLQPDEKVA